MEEKEIELRVAEFLKEDKKATTLPTCLLRRVIKSCDLSKMDKVDIVMLSLFFDF